MDKSLLLALLALIALLIGVGLTVTCRQAVYKGGPKHVYPISKLEEYAESGVGAYIQLSPNEAMYIFYKQSFGFLHPGLYRFSFVIEVQNFEALPYVEIIASFDGMDATIGATFEPTRHSAHQATYTFDKFEVQPLSASEDYAPYSVSHIIRFSPSETQGIVTFYFNYELYETQLPQLVVGAALIIVGAIIGALRLKKLFKKHETPTEPPRGDRIVP